MTYLSLASSNLSASHDLSNIAIALVTALLTLVIAMASAIIGYFISNTRERETNWRNLKIEFYKDFVSAHASMVEADATNEDRLRFSRSCNKLALVASRGVLNALNAYLNEISVSNANRSIDVERECRKGLIWEMRRDIGYMPNKTSLNEFDPPFHTSGN